MMYSCALWSDEEGGLRGDLVPTSRDTSGDLEAAQLRKIHLVLRKARVQPGHRVLEFGSGWGAMAIEVCGLCSMIMPPLTQRHHFRSRLHDPLAVRWILSPFPWSRRSWRRNESRKRVSKTVYESTSWITVSSLPNLRRHSMFS